MNMAQELELPSVDEGAMIDARGDDVPVIFHSADDQLSQQSCDDPLTDPLALDDCLNGDMSDTMNINLNSSSQDGEVILVDVDQLKNVSMCAVASESVAVLGSDHEPDEAYEQTDLLKPAETVEEGVPSDGSDSGLGSDQSANIESQSIRPIICKYYFCTFFCKMHFIVLL